MQQEQWVADRATLQRLLQRHPEWTQQELADWIGRSVGWVKKWVKRLREAPPGDTLVLFGKSLGRKTPYPQIDPEVEERILAIRDAPPEESQADTRTTCHLVLPPSRSSGATADRGFASFHAYDLEDPAP